jgi:hypothetical protein
MEPDYRPSFYHGPRGNKGPQVLFVPNLVRLDTAAFPEFKGQQLYFREQAADAVPFPEEAGTSRNLPSELIGRTNREMWDKYGLALAGAVAPADARTHPRILGLIGKPVTYRPSLVVNQALAPRLERHQLGAQALNLVMTGDPRKVSNPRRVVTPPVDLHEGWNLVTQRIDGSPRSFLIFGGNPQQALRAGN